MKQIRQSTYTTKGELPPKHLRNKLKPQPEEKIVQRGKKTKKQVKYQEKTEEDFKIAQEKLTKFTYDLMDSINTNDDDFDDIDMVLLANKSRPSYIKRRQSMKRASIADLNLTDAKANVAKRLASSSSVGFDTNETINGNQEILTSRSDNSESLQRVEESPSEVTFALEKKEVMGSEQSITETMSKSKHLNEELQDTVSKHEDSNEEKEQCTNNNGTSPEEDSGAQKRKKKKKIKSEGSDGLTFDADLYHPDGRLRTLHRMPDFLSTIKQAKKARYVRHKEKQWFEKELSIGEIFPLSRKLEDVPEDNEDN